MKRRMHPPTAKTCARRYCVTSKQYQAGMYGFYTQRLVAEWDKRFNRVHPNSYMPIQPVHYSCSNRWSASRHNELGIITCWLHLKLGSDHWQPALHCCASHALQRYLMTAPRIDVLTGHKVFHYQLSWSPRFQTMLKRQYNLKTVLKLEAAGNDTRAGSWWDLMCSPHIPTSYKFHQRAHHQTLGHCCLHSGAAAAARRITQSLPIRLRRTCRQHQERASPQP